MDAKVRMYTLSTCSHCKAAKRLMRELGVDFEFVDVDLLEGEERERILEEVSRYNPRMSYPTIIIGGTVIVGTKEHEIKRALGLV